MSAFERLSLGHKLSLTTALALGIALALSSVLFLAYDRATVQRTISRRLHSEGEIVAFNSATALVFRDPESAQRMLAALQSDGHVESARIHTPDGRVFAEYVRTGSLAPEPRAEAVPTGPAERFERDDLVLSRPIVLEGRPVGTLVIRADLRERDERFRTYAAIVIVVSLLSLTLALFVGRAAQRSVSEPLLDLAAASRRIAQHSDFSVRVGTRSQDEVGALVGAFNHMLDGLQRRDDELQAAHAELERRIQEADAANRVKDEFLATLSHELRTPLNAILGWAQILRGGGMEPAVVDRALETISRNALTQSQIVADILDMQRIAAGKLRLNLQALELGDVIQRAMDTVGPAARAKEIELHSVLDPSAGAVLGDEDRLQQVMWNLLSNAVKFTPKGGRVSVGLAKVNSHVELAVEDTGPGLEPEFIPYAFDRFRQADSSSTRRHGGLGLGLAIVRNLVELHGGSVEAGNRTTGSGALFVVKLPLMSVRPSQRPAAVEQRHPGAERDVSWAATPGLHGIRVLVVDDDPDSRELVAAALTGCGADVSSVGSAPEAIEMLKRTRPDVLVSDIEMPGEDGYSLMRRIRALSADEGGLTPAAALTAYAGTEDRMRVLAAGFQMHVPKPAEPAELAAVVQSLAQRRARAGATSPTGC